MFSFQRPDVTFIRPFILNNQDGTYGVFYIPDDLGVYAV